MADFATIFHSLPPEKQQKLLNGPSAHPPPGIIPNFDHPQNQNELAFGVTTSALIISSLFIILWIYSKVLYLKRIYLADVFIFSGYGILIGYGYCTYSVINLTGWYVHSWDVRLRIAFDFSYIIYVGSNLYGAILLALKVGLLLEWKRIFVPRGTRDNFWWTCMVNLGLNVLFYVAVKIADNLSCFPRERIWDRTVEGQCIDQKALILASAIVNLVSDLLILALPQMVIWKLHMSFSQRLGIACVFAVGIFCCVAAIFRIIVNYQYYYGTDPIYELSPVALWNIVEITLVIMVVCLPSIPIIFKNSRVRSLWPFMKSWIGSSHDTDNSASRGKQPSYGSARSFQQSTTQQFEERSLSALANDTHQINVSAESHGTQPEPKQYPAQNSIVLTTTFTAQIEHGDGSAFPRNFDFDVYHPGVEQAIPSNGSRQSNFEVTNLGWQHPAVQNLHYPCPHDNPP